MKEVRKPEEVVRGRATSREKGETALARREARSDEDFLVWEVQEAR